MLDGGSSEFFSTMLEFLPLKCLEILDTVLKKVNSDNSVNVTQGNRAK